MLGWNSFSGGLYSFYQKENDLFGVEVNDGSLPHHRIAEHTGQRQCGLAGVLLSAIICGWDSM